MPSTSYPFKDEPWSSHQQLLNLIPPGAKVLDLGCGQGVLARRLAATGCQVWAVDTQVPASGADPSLHFIQHDLELGLPRNLPTDFDCLLLADVVEHLRNAPTLLAQARPLLRPGGTVLASTGNVAHWYIRLNLLCGRFNYAPRGILDHTHVKLYTLASFRHLLKSTGYTIEQVYVTPIPWLHLFGHGLLWRGVYAVDYALARLWKGLFAYQFILRCRLDGPPL